MYDSSSGCMAVNRDLLYHVHADTLMQAWVQSTTARQRREVVSAVAQTLQTISQAEAQALPDKDPDVAAIL